MNKTQEKLINILLHNTDLKQDEIADKVLIPRGTMKSHLHRKYDRRLIKMRLKAQKWKRELSKGNLENALRNYVWQKTKRNTCCVCGTVFRGTVPSSTKCSQVCRDKSYNDSRDPVVRAYDGQRLRAKERGIPFLFALDEWVQWWGNDLKNRGCRDGQLVMARLGDTGPYSPENVEKITCNQNSIDYHNNTRVGLHGND